MDTINFNTIFKEKFLENFTNNMSLSTIVVTLSFAFLLSIIVFFVYKYTTTNVIYSKKFNVSMALMSIVTAAIILSMQANIVVSLGMVGALSIVRFRTAIKEPRDLLFLFWSIGNGIIIGANIFGIAIILTIVLIIAMIFFEAIPENKLPYLLVLNCDNFKSEEEVLNCFKNNKIKFNIKSRNINKEKIDVVFEIINAEKIDLLQEISGIKGIINANLISQDSEIHF